MDHSVQLAPTRCRWIAAAALAYLLGATTVVWFVAGKNFAIVDLENNPRLAEVFAAIEGDEARRMAVRYIASESNRAMFGFFAPLQVLCSLVAVLAATWARRRTPLPRDRWVIPGLFLVLLLSIAMSVVTPLMIEQGRSIDFESRSNGVSPAVQNFQWLHAGYMIVGSLSMLAAVALIVSLLTRQQRPRSSNRSLA